MKRLIVYIHGMGGSPEEAGHFAELFPDCEVKGMDYKSDTPWEAVPEFQRLWRELTGGYHDVWLIANSLGAYFSLCSLAEESIARVFFISPVVDMRLLIEDMMHRDGVTEEELNRRGIIETSRGEVLSAEYLAWVKGHPVSWRIPTEVLYGENDLLQPIETVEAFVSGSGAELTVMKNGEHWFHTPVEMDFLDNWILSKA